MSTCWSNFENEDVLDVSTVAGEVASSVSSWSQWDPKSGAVHGEVLHGHAAVCFQNNRNKHNNIKIRLVIKELDLRPNIPHV